MTVRPADLSGDPLLASPDERASVADVGWSFLLLGFGTVWSAAFFIAFSPGLMSTDSLLEYSQGVLNEYGNWHPPVLAFLMGRSVAFQGTLAPLFLVQLVGFVTPILLLLKRVPATARRWAAAWTFVFLVLPPTWATLMAHWKDVWLTDCLLWATAAFVYRRWALGGAALLGAVCFRHNAVLPASILLLMAVLLAWREGLDRRVVVALAMATWVGCLLGPLAIEKALKARDEWPAGQWFIFDLAGIYQERPELAAHGTLAQSVDIPSFVKRYTPVACIPLFIWDHTGQPHYRFDVTPSVRAGLVREWASAIFRAFPSYVRHRANHFQSLLSLPPYGVIAPYHGSVDWNPFGVRWGEASPIRRLLVSWRDWFHKTTPLFEGWPWFLASFLALLSWGRRVGLVSTAFWVLLSGFLYVAANLIVGVGSDFRYLHWMVVTLGIAPLLRDCDVRIPSAIRQEK